ncbi:MAG: amidohydrolase family protein [Dehalococcoidia bacterium]
MRNGHKVFDCDTHLRPTVETTKPYLDPKLRARVPEWDKVPVRIGMAGETYGAPYRHYFRFRDGGEGWGRGSMRMLGQAALPENPVRTFQKFMGTKFPSYGGGDFDVDARVRDMDEEGVDVQLMVPGGVPRPEDPELEMGFIRAQHRYLNDFANKDPHRLKSLILASGRCIEGSLQEIRTWARSPWAVGVELRLGLDQPLDHPILEPIWAAVEGEGLCVVHHSFSYGYPGYRDLWDNRFIGRLASHPWAAMRAMAAFFGSGIMDRYPSIRFGILESGFGWLPFWARRMDDQAIYIGAGALPENLKYKLSEYMTGGRFFAGIVIHEGEEMAKMVTDFLGDQVLMYASDYPHAESRFPESVDKVLSWKSLGPAAMRKLMWDNAVRYYGEP